LIKRDAVKLRSEPSDGRVAIRPDVIDNGGNCVRYVRARVQGSWQGIDDVNPASSKIQQ